MHRSWQYSSMTLPWSFPAITEQWRIQVTFARVNYRAPFFFYLRIITAVVQHSTFESWTGVFLNCPCSYRIAYFFQLKYKYSIFIVTQCTFSSIISLGHNYLRIAFAWSVSTKLCQPTLLCIWNYRAEPMARRPWLFNTKNRFCASW